MDAPVDLTNLRGMIDHDADLEKELITEFFIEAEKQLAILAESAESALSSSWARAAHALKGISFNLGADKLGELAKIAQDIAQDTVQEKQQKLQFLQAEYAVLKQFLTSADH